MTQENLDHGPPTNFEPTSVADSGPQQRAGLQEKLKSYWKQNEAGWRTPIVVIGVIIFFAQYYRQIYRPRGDFKLHWELGRRLAAGEFIYEGGLDHPYPPFWALLHSPLSVFDTNTAQLITYPLFLIALGLLFVVLNRMTRDRIPLKDRQLFWVTALTAILASRYLIRDTREIGINLTLVTMSWAAVYLWMRRREWAGGSILGLAISMKCTPALFLAYFFWKRQWKMVATTSVAAAAFTLSPVLVMGPSGFAQAGEFWFKYAKRGLVNRDPSQGVLGDEAVQNISLRPALGRYLMHIPEGHSARLDHPLYFDFFNLSPMAAEIAVKIIMLALLVTVLWTMRNRVEDRGDTNILWECSAISLLLLLFSPITWGQHCVGVVPALYLILRTTFSRGSMPKFVRVAIYVYAGLILGLNRELVGKQLSWLIDSYRINTICLLGLLGIVLYYRIKCPADTQVGQTAGRTSAPIARAA